MAQTAISACSTGSKKRKKKSKEEGPEGPLFIRCWTMRIYLYEGKQLHGEAAYPLIRLAAEMYAAEEGLDLATCFSDAGENLFTDVDRFLIETKIGVTDKGKPFFENLPLEFSVTNSGEMWMCAISEKPCGIDLQVAKDAPHGKIAERFFKPEESEYVKTFGEEGFFRLWVRREAYGKMTGEGLWGDMPSLVCAGAHGDLEFLENIDGFNISDIEIGEGIYCAVCTADSEPYQIILL